MNLGSNLGFNLGSKPGFEPGFKPGFKRGLESGFEPGLTWVGTWVPNLGSWVVVVPHPPPRSAGPWVVRTWVQPGWAGPSSLNLSSNWVSTWVLTWIKRLDFQSEIEPILIRS